MSTLLKDSGQDCSKPVSAAETLNKVPDKVGNAAQITEGIRLRTGDAYIIV